MEKDRKIKKYSVIALIVALLGLTVAFAVVSSTLRISGTARANKSGINVVFEKIPNMKISKSSGVLTTLDEPEVKQSGLELDLGDITLNEIGDYYQYSINIVNKGKSAAKVSGIEVPNITEEALEYFTPTFRYENGLDVGIDDTIASGQYKKVNIRVELNSNLTDEEYEAMSDDLVLNLNGITLSFEKYEAPITVEDNRGTVASNVINFNTGEFTLYGNDLISSELNNGNSDGYRVTFLNTNEQYPGTTGSFDGSQDKDGSVTVSYLLAQDNYYDIYIGSDGGVIAPSNSSYLFINASSITNLNYLDTSNVTNMEGMFVSYKGSTLDLSNFNTSNVTNMNYMFQQANVTSLNLSSFDTRNVTDMAGMFSDCKLLEEINLSSFVTTSVTDMSWMFSKCQSLKEINISSFNTSKVTTFRGIFNSCTTATLIDMREATFDAAISNDAFEDSFYNVPSGCKVIVNNTEIQGMIQNQYGDLLVSTKEQN